MPKTKKKDTIIVEDTMESIPVDDSHADGPSYTVDEFAACSREVFGILPEVLFLQPGELPHLHLRLHARHGCW